MAPNDSRGLVKRIWMLLYAEGGRWTEAEIRKSLRLAADAHTCLREMVDRGFIVRHRLVNIDGEKSTKYAVTKACKFPRGVSIEEVEQLLKLGSMPEVVYVKPDRAIRGRPLPERVGVVRAQIDLFVEKAA